MLESSLYLTSWEWEGDVGSAQPQTVNWNKWKLSSEKSCWCFLMENRLMLLLLFLQIHLQPVFAVVSYSRPQNAVIDQSGKTIQQILCK